LCILQRLDDDLSQENTTLFDKYALSRPSLAKRIFIKGGLDVQLEAFPYVNDFKMDEFLRQAYLGGTSRIVRHHARDVHVYDVNSLYPFAKLGGLPTGGPTWVDFTPGQDLGDFYGLVAATVTVPAGDPHSSPLPPLLTQLSPSSTGGPLRPDGSIYAPSGTFPGLFVADELRDAIEHYGVTIQLHYGLEYPKGPVAENYIRHFTKIKTSTEDPIKRQLAKLFLNGLYGKLAQRPISVIQDHKPGKVPSSPA
jgi:hypothetical protein